MNRRLLVAALIILLATVACGVNRGAYIAANEAIIDELSLFPGAIEIVRESNSYSSNDGGIFDPATGYGTRITYRIPPDTTQNEVLDFYISLAGTDWTLRVEETQTIILDGHTPGPGDTATVEPTPTVYGEPNRQYGLCRGESLVSIDAVNAELNHTFDLYVDHSYAEPGGRTAC